MIVAAYAIATPSLAAAWIVHGRGGRVRRVFVGTAAAVCSLAVGYAGYAFGYWRLCQVNSYQTVSDWAAAWFAPDYLRYYSDYYGPKFLFGLATLILVLTAAKRSGWFHRGGDAPTASSTVEMSGVSPAGRVAARTLFVAMLAMMTALNLTVLWALATPTPLPAATPGAGGWDRLVEIGAGISDDFDDYVEVTIKRDFSRLSELAKQMEPVCEQIAAALDTPATKPSWPAWQDEGAFDDPTQLEAYLAIELAVMINANHARQREDLDAEVESLVLQSRLMQLDAESESSTGVSINSLNFFFRQQSNSIIERRHQMSEVQLKATIAALVRLDAATPTFETIEKRQRLIDQNSGWEKHRGLLLDDWSGFDHYWSMRRDHHAQSAFHRIAITELALELYRRDHGGPAETLGYLVPEYLPDIPIDPFNAEPLRYRIDGDEGVLYSIGPDGVDDLGKPMVRLRDAVGDLTAETSPW